MAFRAVFGSICRVRGLKKFREISPLTSDARQLWREEQFTVQVGPRVSKLAL